MNEADSKKKKSELITTHIYLTKTSQPEKLSSLPPLPNDILIRIKYSTPKKIL